MRKIWKVLGIGALLALGLGGPIAFVEPGFAQQATTSWRCVTGPSPSDCPASLLYPLPTGGFASVVSASVTRSANTTTYTANTGWNGATAVTFTWPGVCATGQKIVFLPSIDIWSSANPTTKLQGILWIFNALPSTIIADNATFQIAAADYAKLTADSFNGIPFTLTANQASGAANSGVSLTIQNLWAQCATGSTSLYGMVQVVNAYVPANAEVLTIALSDAGIN